MTAISGKIKLEASCDKEKAVESVFRILEKNKLLTLATVNKDGSPHVCSNYFVFDDSFNLYIWTDFNSKHSKNIGEGSKVSVNIADTSQKWGSMLSGLQIDGFAKSLSMKESLVPAKKYMKRYPLVSGIVKNLAGFHSKKLESKIYKIEMVEIKILDERKFGKEEHQELTVLRI